ncbi:MAG: reverse transcriptase family protein [Actinobacteria bacterium]|nr:reverse transcriptase family protein [Actinomycetota bacterium]MBU1608520.1 reverse transcriptase family protein [Actinomycetota bacterium]MBU2315324.1 reverse transcriptase family protein [Actinomycetota bacterium]MBU2384754.1 reverse transcriptase family protein [Actinomycetota bacterium]
MTPPTHLEYSVVDSVGVLAGQLGRTAEDLFQMAEEIASNVRYETQAVRIRGKVRILTVPDDRLKYLQRDICEFLIPANDRLSPEVHGFARGRSNRSNAISHAGRIYIQRFDLKDFFGSVTSAQVLAAFRELGLSDPAAHLLTELTTYRRALPQGAPTSPILSNLVMREVDDRMRELAHSRSLSFSRYADDMAFGGNERFDLSSEVEDIIDAYGFRLNDSKTAFAGPGQPRFVTGLYIDEDRVRLRKSFKRKLTQTLHYVEKFGIDDHADRVGKAPSKAQEQLRGRIHYARQVEPAWLDKQRSSFPRTLNELVPMNYEATRGEYLLARRQGFLSGMAGMTAASALRYVPAVSYAEVKSPVVV